MKSSPVGQQQLNAFHIALVDDRVLPQGAFALARFGAQDMAAKRLVVDDFTGARLLEPLGGGAVGFDFRHIRISFANDEY
jgi:hypothetical protein